MTLPDLLVRHGVAVLFVWAFAVQAGMPMPAVPMLLGAGALSGSGQMSLALAVGAAVAAALCADVLWYAMGRLMGARVLETLCRLSLNPDSFVRDAKERFVAHGVKYVVLAKFLPGLNPLAAGLAGTVPIRLGDFCSTRRPAPCSGPERGSLSATSARMSSHSLRREPRDSGRRGSWSSRRRC